ncbi:uncharacterized protein BT62DRAFT_1001323 [Guyanagaster necrorhizus]|uniref:Uncharacterized protein n=1 Tax=Guyanagaster necrorhizus TaxID=856835 RepID=A0A9P7W1L6_9AGAR|nr:uncharacterized protein BT62DRAFT_1001323 [Guyanagaster necrorhizus MCA 3950]KAG7450507.1 hypothetical protein BT62DRAFT_1001323 [Guyanagaster necrorhizus MCA 3950]
MLRMLTDPVLDPIGLHPSGPLRHCNSWKLHALILLSCWDFGVYEDLFGLSTPCVHVVCTLVEAQQILTLSDLWRTRLVVPVVSAIMRSSLCLEVSGCVAVLSVVDDTSVLYRGTALHCNNNAYYRLLSCLNLGPTIQRLALIPKDNRGPARLAFYLAGLWDRTPIFFLTTIIVYKKQHFPITAR